ncbi:MAG: KaiB protein [Marmoricola sp.]|nr:KaiB protein [Marmoricola sp.]
MMTNATQSDTAQATRSGYRLVLYVCGATPHCMLAIKNINDICRTYLSEGTKVEVIDVIQHPEAAVRAQIIAAPTLIKYEPGPERRLIGDLSNTDKVLAALGIYDV